MGDKGWREERGAQDTLTNHCQRRHPRVTAGGRGWRGQRRLIGLNLTLVQARHIVSDKRFTRVPGGRTQTRSLRREKFPRWESCENEYRSLPSHARKRNHQRNPSRHCDGAPASGDGGCKNPRCSLHLSLFFFSSGGMCVRVPSPPALPMATN